MMVRDREGLEEAACECYGIINQLFARVFDGWPQNKSRMIVD
jgi:hypothetical protein